MTQEGFKYDLAEIYNLRRRAHIPLNMVPVILVMPIVQI